MPMFGDQGDHIQLPGEAPMTRQRLAGLFFVGLMFAAARAGDQTEEPITPREVLRPFNGKDSSKLYTWLKKTQHEDPQRVFRVEGGTIRCGAEDMGYIATR